MQQKLFELLLFLIININDISADHKHNKQITKSIYHVDLIGSTFTTEDKNFFEKNSLIATLNTK